MKTSALVLAPLGILVLAATSAAAEAVFRSSSERTHLLELYTSEGCSSCPPAERWMTELKQSPRLWKQVVPVAFHVDYWDGLGWPDRFASNAHTARQRQYAASWGTSTVYTPGFVLDGLEWRERSLGEIPSPAGDAGVLTATVDGGRIAISYVPAKGRGGKWETHVAVLGFGMSSQVKAGENSGRTLLHDFVAMSHETKALTSSGGTAVAELDLPALVEGGEYGVAVWVTQSGRPQPVQAVGGRL